MKKIFFFSAIAFLTLSSCRKEVPTLAKDQALAQSQSQTNASTENALPYNIQNYISLDGVVISNACTNESVILSGICHVFGHGVYNPQTNTSIDDFHINLQGVKGMGETTGNTYEVKDNISERKIISYDGCILTFSGSEIFKITSANANNNFIFKMKLIYTYNFCTLEQTVKRDVSSTECQ
jgi:hypothetical protein